MYRSFGEIAFACLGRPSVFVINFVITAATSLIVVMYALLFGKICESIAKAAFGNVYSDDGEKDLHETIFTSKIFYIVLLYIILLPNILKKNIKELRFTSILLVFGVVSMLVIFLAKMVFKEYFTNPNDKIQPPYTKGSLVDSVTIVLTSYGFILNFYPIFAQLEVKTNRNGYFSTLLAMFFCFVAYISFSFLAMESYGENLNPNIFDNLQNETNIASYFIRLVFLAIFICNIPFVFLPGKECLLMIIDEIKHKTISQ